MSVPPLPTNGTPNANANSGRGCFFYGCITTLVLAVILAIGGYLGVRAMLKNAVDNFTQTTPMALPKVNLTAAEQTALDERITAFTEALKQHQPAELSLNEAELNAFLYHNAAAKDKIYVRLQGDQVQGQISYPLGPLGFIDLTGHYLNGEATFTIALQDGKLEVNAKTITVNGSPLPPQFMDAFRKENLAKKVGDDPKVAESLARLESIRVSGGVVRLKGRSSP